MGMLCIMIVEINSQKGHNLREFLYPIVGVFSNVGLIKIKLSKIEIKVIVSILQIL